MPLKKSEDIELIRDGSYYPEVHDATFGKSRIIWTDGFNVDCSW